MPQQNKKTVLHLLKTTHILNMKYQILAIITIIAFGLTACAPDACEDVNCLNEGVCETGDCVCADGFEGPNCATEQRQAFVGTYSAADECDLGSFSYNVSISADSEAKTEITLNNIGDFNFDITGVVNGTSVTITDQMSNGSTINGTGQLTDGTLIINYTLVNATGQTITCILTGLIQE